MFELVWPAEEYLPSYADALRRGWSPNTMRPEAAQEELARVDADPAAFVRSKVDREAAGGPITLPDGSQVNRLPGVALWMWDGAFCGAINLRWQLGTPALPPHVLGHVGYSVVPWKRRRGYATRALALLLPVARAEGLREYVELTTDPDNIGSQRVIEANGGVLVERFNRPASMGGTLTLRYRVALG